MTELAIGVEGAVGIIRDSAPLLIGQCASRRPQLLHVVDDPNRPQRGTRRLAAPNLLMLGSGLGFVAAPPLGAKVAAVNAALCWSIPMSVTSTLSLGVA